MAYESNLQYRPSVDRSRYETLPYDPRSNPPRYETLPYRLRDDQRRDPVDASGLLEEFIQNVISTPTTEIAQGIPVGEDPNLPMSQDQFRDWVNRSRDYRDNRTQQFLDKYGSMSDFIRQNRGVRGI